ncbi:MAG: choice-of-anchor tandem repeat GloVer-containing protein [Candidatus Korobacteraceae bacterium]|jgi:uncharacterized repeat protein (TIGR03803 family)
MDLWMTLAAVAIATLLIVLATQAQAQTFTVLHNFTGPDGMQPTAGLTMDRAGNLYGTASLGGYAGGDCYNGCGIVFKLSHQGSGWTLDPLHTFIGTDGALPQARVIFGPDGNLYGTTTNGGLPGYGTIFRLQPSANACKTALCPWTETVLYSYQGGNDGESPQYGDLVFDQAGNIYGTTWGGGNHEGFCTEYGCGTVFELSPSNGGWRESVLYRFQGTNDGANPYAGVTFDTAGNIYGTTQAGGTSGVGTVYELTPSASGWTETILHNFSDGRDGGEPYGGLIFDQSGNLYGTTSTGGSEGGGTVFELTPSNGGWNFNVLYSFNAYMGSLAKLAMDTSGRLYGTILIGSPEVFQLTLSNGQWTQTGFNGSAGVYPFGNVIFDAAGNLYSTASEGGTEGKGVVFEITR